MQTIYRLRAEIAAAVFTMLMLVSMPACDTISSINLFSEQEEADLGRQLDDEIRKNPREYPIYNRNPAVKAYIRDRVFKEVIASPAVERKNVFNYTLEIVENDSVLNAFTTSGGYIYIYTGLLRYIDSEAALAGVIAHEVSHAEERHTTRRMTKEYGASLLLSIVLGESPGQLTVIAANLFTGLAFLANSRSDEEDSDRYSIEILRSTRYYAGSVKFFFEKMRDEGLVNENNPKILTYLSTHPDPIKRIDEANQKLTELKLPIKTYKSNDADIFRSEYQANIRSRL